MGRTHRSSMRHLCCTDSPEVCLPTQFAQKAPHIPSLMRTQRVSELLRTPQRRFLEPAARYVTFHVQKHGSDGFFSAGQGAAAFVVCSVVVMDGDRLQSVLLGARGTLIEGARSAFHAEVSAIDLATEWLMKIRGKHLH